MSKPEIAMKTLRLCDIRTDGNTLRRHQWNKQRLWN